MSGKLGKCEQCGGKFRFRDEVCWWWASGGLEPKPSEMLYRLCISCWRRAKERGSNDNQGSTSLEG